MVNILKLDSNEIAAIKKLQKLAKTLILKGGGVE